MTNKHSSAEITGRAENLWLRLRHVRTLTVSASLLDLQAGRPHTGSIAAQLVHFKRFVDWRDIPSPPSLPIWPEAVYVLS